MWIRLASVALCLVGGAAHAQSASDSISGLELCIEAAHFANAICAKMPNDPTQRADCFAQARAAQLECLDRVLSQTSSRSAPPGSSETAQPSPPVATAPPQASPERPASKGTGRTSQPEVSVGSMPAGEAAKPSNASPKTAPASVAPSAAEAPIRSAPPVSSSETARPEPPVETAPPAASPERAASKETGRTDQPVSVGSDPAGEAAKRSNAPPKPAPASVAPSAAEAPIQSAPPVSSSETARPEPPVETAPPAASPERAASKETGRTDQPVSVGGDPAGEAAKRSNASPEPAPASVPPSAAEAPTGAIPSHTSAKKDDKPAQETDWIVSETTSPIDYSPLVAAVLHSTSNAKDSPNILAVRCRAQHTELFIRTDGAWGVPRRYDLLVEYQINDRPVVRQPWILSADGKTATYKYDAAEPLRSMPEGATLKVAVADNGNVRREATFQLTGLSAIRQKIGTACKWGPATAKTSSESSHGTANRPVRTLNGALP